MKEGATKFDTVEQKADLSLIPMDLLGKVARSYMYGLVKYTRHNWRKGFDTNRSIAAALRHISKWQDEGQEYDRDAYDLSGMKVHHIEMAIFNLLCVLDSVNNHPENVNNYIPIDYKSEVPLEPEVAERVDKLRLKIYNDKPDYEKVKKLKEECE